MQFLQLSGLLSKKKEVLESAGLGIEQCKVQNTSFFIETEGKSWFRYVP
jgi:hypothetical protein